MTAMHVQIVIANRSIVCAEGEILLDVGFAEIYGHCARVSIANLNNTISGDDGHENTLDG